VYIKSIYYKFNIIGTTEYFTTPLCKTAYRISFNHTPGTDPVVDLTRDAIEDLMKNQKKFIF
ncbi:MAG: hypothetical protein ACK5ZT_10450, partial [Sphingobacteriaceae bacterium]